jgi:hypothetical protein
VCSTKLKGLEPGSLGQEAFQVGVWIVSTLAPKGPFGAAFDE